MLGYSLAKLLKKLTCNFTVMQAQIKIMKFCMPNCTITAWLSQTVLKHSLNNTQVDFMPPYNSSLSTWTWL